VGTVSFEITYEPLTKCVILTFPSIALSSSFVLIWTSESEVEADILDLGKVPQRHFHGENVLKKSELRESTGNVLVSTAVGKYVGSHYFMIKAYQIV
jgi:hypothetical protein